ncbi:MAG TPA: energy transducer TonB [Mucilaginibacter sp.]|nr:energy transducer TonB [Mucilaginibacter sp.]
MKRLLISSLFLLSFLFTKAQSKDTLSYKDFDKIPVLPGGVSGFDNYIHENLKYPESARKNQIEGTLYVSFDVKPDGNTTNIKIVKGLSPDTDAEVLRLIKNLPKWAPAMLNGHAIRFGYFKPIVFKLPTRN